MSAARWHGQLSNICPRVFSTAVCGACFVFAAARQPAQLEYGDPSDGDSHFATSHGERAAPDMVP
jgi:hypothetical protein